MKIGVIGATGFTGEKLIEILLTHPEAELVYLSARVDKKVKLSGAFPKFKKKTGLFLEKLNLEKAEASADLFFLALPHTVSFKIAPFFIKKGKTVIDLSADYRFKDAGLYKKFYKTAHKDKKNLPKAVYGLPEFYREDIKKSKLIANPGCYPTVSILSCAPLLREKVIKDIIIDAKSGITGAGRKPSLNFHFAHLSGNMYAYKLFSHQHQPEIERILSDLAGRGNRLIFTPHVIPAERGILITVYAGLLKRISKKDIIRIYSSYYRHEKFVRILKNRMPQLKDVADTNFCDIGFEVKGDKIIISSAIDNLMKGASGQAVQNMNIILGVKEDTGLK